MFFLRFYYESLRCSTNIFAQKNVYHFENMKNIILYASMSFVVSCQKDKLIENNSISPEDDAIWK